MLGDKEIILEINDLKLYYKTTQGFVRAVDGVSLNLMEGETLGLVGESGCGKTTLMKAVLKLSPPNCQQTGGAILFKGRDLGKATEKEMQSIRWQEISLISQSAMNALDPVYRVGEQIVEAILTHDKNSSKSQAWTRAEELFELAGISPKRLRDYPHQFSGGMKQRAVIAMALALNPSIIIADEPTTALDVVVQAQILERINALQRDYGGSLIMVTHDISVIAQTCKKIAVMYGGKIIEYGTVNQVLKEPLHPYSMGLKNAFPSLTGTKKTLISIPGTPPDLLNPGKGCRFEPRCPFSLQECRTSDPPSHEAGGRMVACHRFAAAEKLRELAGDEATWEKGGNGYGRVG